MSSSQSQSANRSINSSAAVSIDPKELPLWKYVTKFGKVGSGGGVSWKCNYCGVDKTTSYTRLKTHLLDDGKGGITPCSAVSPEQRDEMQRDEDVYKNKAKSKAPKDVPLPPPRMSTHSELYGRVLDDSENAKAKKRKGTANNNTIGAAFNTQERNHLHALIARLFYSSGLPFHLARSPYFVSSFAYAANHNLVGYVPPGYNLLRGPLLQQEKAHVEQMLLPVRSSWQEKGVSIVSDGWSDTQRRPLINFMAVTENGPMFLKAVDCSGEIKDKNFIAALMIKVIEEFGPKNVIQVITDNARNCSSAGALVEKAYPHIVWTPCVVHTLNLALQNICAAKNVQNNIETYDECSWISIIAGDVLMIKNFIMNHQKRLHIFNTFVPLKLLTIAPTRFASTIVMLKRFKLLKRSLETMVMSEEWNNYRDDDATKAAFVKEKVVNDDWWDKVDYILSLTGPIYDMLRDCDTDKPCLHLVYDMWDSMIQKVKVAIYNGGKKTDEEKCNFYKVVHKILVSRWSKNTTPLHCLAHSLNPRYYSAEWLGQDSSRTAPHKDKDVSRERTRCFRKYFPKEEDFLQVNNEYADFSTIAGEFSDIGSMGHRYTMDPKSWWVIYGAGEPLLQTIALKLLVQPSSSSCAERNWSTYLFVTQMKRNKLTPKRAEDLVYVHSNLRLLSRRTPEYDVGVSKMWDIGGDAFGSLDDVGDLEVAQLSLDEPELESVLFSNDQGGGTTMDVDAIDIDD